MDDRLDELSRSNALLGVALGELRTTGISNATADALLDVEVADAELAEFLDLAARDAPQTSVFGLALSLPEYIDRRRVGHDALDYLLTEGNLDKGQLDFVSARMSGVTSPDAVLWCHRRLTTVIKVDNSYYHFLKRHIAIVADQCRDEMTAYLLYPNRGPESANIDSFDLVVRAVGNPGPFFVRWREWIWNGLFSPGGPEWAIHARVHYKILNQRWHEPLFDDLRQTTHDYVLAHLGSLRPEQRAVGICHLARMIDARYFGVAEFIQHVPASELLLHEAMSAAAAANAAPADKALKARADELQYEVALQTQTR